MLKESRHCIDEIMFGRDYIGGPLSTFLYSLPISKKRPTSYVTSNVLRNNSAFRNPADIEEYLTEYMGESQNETLLKLMKVKLVTNVPVPTEKETFTLDHYLYWAQRDERKWKFSELLDRARLEKWLYTLTFKITIPYTRLPWDWRSLIYSPLNVTIIFRLLIHLYDLGYPAHWLGSFLSSVLAGEVMTSARPPRSCPLSTAELKASRPFKKMSLSPFVAEMRTQATIWMRLMPFGFVAPDLPNIDNIYRYTIKFEDVMPFGRCVPHFILVFAKADFIMGSLREVLLDDETGDSSSQARQLRHEGLVVISTYEWSGMADNTAQGASFWLAQDVMDEMVSDGNWFSVLYRNDTWTPQSDFSVVREDPRGIQKGEKWMDACSPRVDRR
jgi:hypothetical protein